MPSVQDQLDRWRKDLINLGRRNRLLYYKPTKASTLVLTQPTPADLVARLGANGEGPVFYASGPDFDPEDPEPALADEIVARGVEPKLVRPILRNLDRRSNREFLDRGLWILYVALGLLEWREDVAGDQESVKSPLLLLPVQLKRDSAKKPYHLALGEEDPAVNPALTTKLEQDFGLVLPTVDDYEEHGLTSLLDRLREVVRGHRNWIVHDSAILSTFSFHKEVIYRDLKDNEEQVSAHDAVRALAQGQEAGVSFDFAPVPEEELDEKAPPESTVTILDADASQQQCIAAATEGRSFVMDGPPGTGKSQTIANMIVELLAKDKTVLFVSEKAAALDVVHRRLDAAGVADYCLQLHSHKATRREVARALGEALQYRSQAAGGLSQPDRESLRNLRRALSAYAVALNEKRQPLGRSAYQVIGTLAKAHGLVPVPLADGVSVESLSASELAGVMGEAVRLSGFWGPVERDDFVWRDLKPRPAGDFKWRARELAEKAGSTLDVLQKTSATEAAALGLNVPNGPDQATALQTILQHLAKRQMSTPAGWLSGKDLGLVENRLATLETQLEALQSAATSLQSEIGLKWPDLDPTTARTAVALQEQLLAAGLRVSPEWSAVSLKNLAALGGAASSQLRSVGLQAAGIATEVGLSDSSFTITRASEMATLGSLAGDRVRPEREWVNPVVLPELRNGLTALRDLASDCRRRKRNVSRVFKDSVLKLDLDSLSLRFSTVHRGLRKLLPAYRRDRDLLKSVTRSGRVDRKTFGALAEAVSCQSSVRRLEDAEEHHSELVATSYYRGIKTDFDRLDRALRNAETLLSVVAAQLNGAIIETFAKDGPLRPALATAAQALESTIQGWEKAADAAGLAQAMEQFSGIGLTELAAALQSAVAPLKQLASVVDAVSDAAGRPLCLSEVLNLASARQRVAEGEALIGADEEASRAMLGELYSSSATDTVTARLALSWAREIRELVGQCSPERAERLVTASVDSAPLDGAQRKWNDAQSTLVELFTETGATLAMKRLSPSFKAGAEYLRALRESTHDIEQWFNFVGSLDTLGKKGLRAPVLECVRRRISRDEVAAVVEKAVLGAWLESLLSQDSRLRDIHPEQRDSLRADFARLDRALVKSAASDMIAACNARRPDTSLGAAGIILREAQKKRRHMPVRQLLERSSPIPQRLMPCFLMSPLSVSQFLPPSIAFDVVIFDEASQVKPADAINAVYRGARLIVAGDQKQLPPTSFFDAGSIDGEEEWQEDQLEDFESVLDLCKGSGGFPSLSLRWHYRSQHEDLITFSNYAFYEGRLVTFPSSQHRGGDLGVELIRVDGVYRRGGARDNPVEAEEVVKRIVHHRRQHPEASIGVVAFSEAQAQAIEDALDRRRESVPELEDLQEMDRLEGLFVKNLETVQGDERDIIIFSVGYAKDELGKFTLNFGPLNKAGGERRLNVAITRARRRVEVVASISASSLSNAKSEGLRQLHRYLEYVERPDDRMVALRGLPDAPDSKGEAESPFEEEVARVVRSWGFGVVHQVGTAGYRVDLGVLDPMDEGRYLLGVECDGAMYHSSRVARDRDRLRQDMLERLGWTLHRIWGPSWYRDRARAEQRLRKAIQTRLDAPRPPAGGQTRRPEGSATRVERIHVDLDEGGLPGTQTYVVSRPQCRTPGIEMHDPRARREIVRLISAVLDAEAPVHMDLVLQRVREAWGVRRAGKRIQKAYSAIVKRLPVDCAEGFLGRFPDDEPAVRVPNPDDPASVRDISEIPPEELKLALLGFVRLAHVIEVDQLTQRVASLFGWARRGADIASGLHRELGVLAEEGFIRIENGTARLAEGPEDAAADSAA